MYIEIVLPLPIRGEFTYFVPSGMESYIKEGVLVAIDFNDKRYVGIVYSILSTPISKISLQKIKSILSVETVKPIVYSIHLHFWKWISEYYFCFIGEVFKVAFPFLNLDERKKQIKKKIIKVQPLRQLTDLQQNILNQITDNFQQKDVCLLHSVFFVEKTEIYFHLIEETLKQNKQVLYLLPEITITTSCIIYRLKQLFGNKLEVFHSKISKYKRVEIWNSFLNNEGGKVVVGSRSSVFLPFKSLGLIIVEEEHDLGYKQKNFSPRYHARDVAVFLGSLYRSKVLLESITPSIESFYNVQIGKYGYARSENFFKKNSQPQMIAINIHELRRKKIMKGIFSPQLIELIKKQVENEGQVILLQIANYGIAKIEEEIKIVFPSYLVNRMDLDRIQTKEFREKIKIDFETGKIQILVGTRIIFKELNLRKVGLVAILAIDSLMNISDFRAYERTYQLISQVVEKTREKTKSQSIVLLQTSRFDHPLIDLILRQDYQGMYKLQIAERRYFNYPPWCRLIQITIAHKKKEVLFEFSVAYVELLEKQAENCKIIGPDKLRIREKSNVYFRNILLKVLDNISSTILYETLEGIYNQLHFHSSVRLIYNVDPY